MFYNVSLNLGRKWRTNLVNLLILIVILLLESTAFTKTQCSSRQVNIIKETVSSKLYAIIPRYRSVAISVLIILFDLNRIINESFKIVLNICNVI